MTFTSLSIIFLKTCIKNIKTAKKHKNTCFSNCYKNIKTFLHLWYSLVILMMSGLAVRLLRHFLLSVLCLSTV